MQRADPNLEILARAVARLGHLADRMVFLGGCATALLLTDPAAPKVRPTQPDAASQARLPVILDRIRSIARAHP